MQSALERRRLMLEFLSDRRQATLEELALEFSVSKMTVRRDIDVLTCSAPIFTVQGNGGGIRVANGWYVNHRYLNNTQEMTLKKILSGLQPEDQTVIESILKSFAKPADYNSWP